jgi:predicted PurR-regulated permease PerM
VREDDLTVGSFPAWFRRWGIGAWLVLGLALVIVAVVWLLSLTSSIVGPLIAGAVFSVTIAAGTLFGMAGLILAAPLVPAAVNVHDDLAALRTSSGGVGIEGDGAPLAERAPPPADAPSAS